MTNELATTTDVDYGADAGVGADDIELDVQRIPRLGLLQVGSQQCLRGNDNYIPGAEPGMIFNSLTKDLYDPGVGLEVLYIHAEHSYVAWPPRGAGGAGGNAPRFTASKDDPAVRALLAKANGRTFKLPYRDPITDEPLELVNTKTAWVLYGYPKLTPASRYEAQVSFTGTSLNAFDEWELALANLQTASGQRPPCWASVWKLSSRLQSNKKGQSWFAFMVAKTGVLLAPNDPLYALGRELRSLWVRPAGEGQPPALGQAIDQDINF